jgi:predicted dehydrogenase
MQDAPSTDALRVAVVGTGHRAGCFMAELAQALQAQARVIALCDSNPARLQHYAGKFAGEWAGSGNESPVVFAADRFDEMLATQVPDVVLVATPDRTHADYVCRTLAGGASAVVEKPLAIDAPGCQRILETATRTRGQVRVAFNCRFLPCAVRLKELLLANTVGQVISSSLDYRIGVEHGASYFARWHAQKANSGGLLVHKASHHFDMMNWWLDAVPETVFAFGRRAFFGAENREKHGITASAADYYLDADADHGNDPFRRIFTESPQQQELYVNGAAHDGYRGDRNIWRDTDMDIEDSMSVTVRYRTGALFTYSLNAFSPTAGFRAVFNGTRGRIEFATSIPTYLAPADAVAPARGQPKTEETLTVFPLDATPYVVEIEDADGGHGGSDPRLMRELFSRTPGPDPLGQHAGPAQGAASALIGIAANTSIATGHPVAIADLAPDLPAGDALSAMT